MYVTYHIPDEWILNKNLDQRANELLSRFRLIAQEDQATIAARQDVGTSSNVTRTFRNLKKLSTEDARRWVEYWGRSRFIEPQRLRAFL